MELKLSTNSTTSTKTKEIQEPQIDKQLREINELALSTTKDINYTYNQSSNTFHLNYYKDKYFSINNFDFGYLEFKRFLKNLIHSEKS